MADRECTKGEGCACTQVFHVTAKCVDMEGNGGVGRYFLLPGSNGRAAKMAENLKDVYIRKSGRGHDVYCGSLDGIDVGICSTGMGCPSVDIIVTELIMLGARRFLRVGTAGSLQPKAIRYGDIVIANAAVRDEGTSRHYAPLEFPAVASPEMVAALSQAAENLGMGDRSYVGIVHSKDSLYAREFKKGALDEEHRRYMQILRHLGVVASEMEASHLFTLGAVHGSAPTQVTSVNQVPKLLVGTVLAVIGDDSPFAKASSSNPVDDAIKVGLESIRVLAARERQRRPSAF